MTPGIGALLVLAALPCADVDASARALREAAQAGELDAALARLSADLGVELVAGEDAKLSPEQRLDLAAGRLPQICALQAVPAPPSAPAVDAARLQQILTRPEFARARDRRGDALLRLMKQLREWIDSLFETRGAQSFSRVTRVLVLAVALVLVGLAGLGALRLRGWALVRRRKTAAAGPEAERLALDEPAVHLSRARAALEGDPRNAIREGLLGLLSLLERRRFARPDRVKTNREIAAELPSRGAPSALSRSVAELLAWYDRTFYSLEPVPPTEASRFLGEIDRLQRQLAESAA